MVAWIVNDLSLNGQYTAAGAFLQDLELLLKEFAGLEKAGHTLSCAATLQDRPVTPALSCRSALDHWPYGDPRRALAIRWLTKRKVWDCPPEGRGVTYHHSTDVTDQGLGEAARRRWLDEDARTYSFPGFPPFQTTPLDVLCLREGTDAEEIIAVPNAWNISSVTSIISVPPQSTGWTTMIDDACDAFAGLQIARDQIVEEMARYPFDQGARDALYGILKALDDLSLRRQRYGGGSKAVTEWLQVYVQNHSAMFSSEDPCDDSAFLFYDPETKNKIDCPWHGKVHNPLQYRVHYEWPVPQGQTKLKVLYIGDKRTKW